MLEGILALGRARAEDLMTDTVEVATSVRGDKLNPETGLYDTVRTVHYSGKARIKFAYSDNLEQNAGAQVGVQSATLSLPIEGTGTISIGAVVTVTASPFDVSNVGRTYRVVAIHAQTHATARRFIVEHYEQQR